MKQLMYALKGFAIGVANIIPGFSGGTMAVILKIYNEFVDALGKLFTHPIKMIKSYYGLYCGIGLGLISALLVIVKLLESFPLVTVMFFVGLIIGTIPNIYIDFKKYSKIKWYDILGFVLALALIVGLPLTNTTDKEVVNIDFLLIITIVISGILASSSMVIPGVSGSLVLMVLGYYLFILSSIKDCLSSIIHLDFTNLFSNAVILVAFAVGVVIGLVFITKLIKKMFDKTPKLTYSIILGLLIGSPFSILYSVNSKYGDKLNLTNPWIIVFSIITFGLGALLSGYVPRKFEKKEKCE